MKGFRLASYVATTATAQLGSAELTPFSYPFPSIIYATPHFHSFPLPDYLAVGLTLLVILPLSKLNATSSDSTKAVPQQICLLPNPLPSSSTSAARGPARDPIFRGCTSRRVRRAAAAACWDLVVLSWFTRRSPRAFQLAGRWRKGLPGKRTRRTDPTRRRREVGEFDEETTIDALFYLLLNTTLFLWILACSCFCLYRRKESGLFCVASRPTKVRFPLSSLSPDLRRKFRISKQSRLRKDEERCKRELCFSSLGGWSMQQREKEREATRPTREQWEGRTAFPSQSAFFPPGQRRNERDVCTCVSETRQQVDR